MHLLVFVHYCLAASAAQVLDIRGEERPPGGIAASKGFGEDVGELGSSDLGGKLNMQAVIKSAASAASLMTRMQRGPRPHVLRAKLVTAGFPANRSPGRLLWQPT